MVTALLAAVVSPAGPAQTREVGCDSFCACYQAQKVHMDNARDRFISTETEAGTRART